MPMRYSLEIRDVSGLIGYGWFGQYVICCKLINIELVKVISVCERRFKMLARCADLVRAASSKKRRT